MPRDKRIDEYIAQARTDARPILKKLRTLVHTACPEIRETIKWSAPAFDHNGPLFMMAAHKRYVSAGFWKDEKLGGAGTREALRKIISMDRLPSDASIIKLIRDHRQINEAEATAPKGKPARKNGPSKGEGKPLRFAAGILIREGNPYVLVPAARAKILKPGWRRPMPVLVQVNGKPETPWHINMMPRGDGAFYLYLHGDVRKASGTGTGDRVEVALRFDDAYAGGPQHPMPEWFADPLGKNRTAKENWERLPPSRKKEILRYFSWLKSDAARERNIAKALHVLSGSPGRFMARDWKDGR
jgi:hypothetical protein